MHSADYEALLLWLSRLRVGIMKASCCDHQGFVLQTTSFNNFVAESGIMGKWDSGRFWRKKVWCYNNIYVKLINTSLESLAPTFIFSLIPTRIPLSHFPTFSLYTLKNGYGHACDNLTFFLEAELKMFYKWKRLGERTDFSPGKMGL